MGTHSKKQKRTKSTKSTKKDKLTSQPAQMLFTMGVLYGQQGKEEEELATYNQLLKRFGRTQDAEIMKLVAMTLIHKSFVQNKLEDFWDALEACDEVVDRFGNSKNPDLLELVAHAMAIKAVILGLLGRDWGDAEEAIAESDAVIKRFGQSTNVTIHAAVSLAMVNKGVVLGELERDTAGIAVYNEVTDRFGNSHHFGVMENVAIAMVNKASVLERRGQDAAALALYGEVIDRFGSDTIAIQLDHLRAIRFQRFPRLVPHRRPDVMEQVVRALTKKCFRLTELGRRTEAIDDVWALIRKYPNAHSLKGYYALLLLDEPAYRDEGIARATADLAQNPEDGPLFVAVACFIYGQHIWTAFPIAETWARHALALMPEDFTTTHILACILAAMGKTEEALVLAAQCMNDKQEVQIHPEVIAVLVANLAARGQGKAALDLLVASPGAKYFEAFILGLRLFLGESVQIDSPELQELGQEAVNFLENHRKRLSGVTFPDMQQPG